MSHTDVSPNYNKLKGLLRELFQMDQADLDFGIFRIMNAKRDEIERFAHTRDQEYDLIYVNGDNNLENLRREDQTWKVRLIEEDFHKLMWECQDV